MGDFLYDDVKVAVNKSADGQLYEAGLVVNGAFHRFAQFKVGGFDDRMKKAADAANATDSQSSE